MKKLLHILKIIPLATTIVLLVCFATIPEFYIYILVEHLLILIPALGNITILLYNHRLRNAIIYWVLITIIIYNVEPKIIGDIKKTKNTNYYLSTGVHSHTLSRGPGYALTYYFQYSSLQVGYESMTIERYEEKYSRIKNMDTVILHHAYELPNYIIVHNANPTHEEIEKYMEPMLYLDGKEQHRPKYDTLKPSPNKEIELLRRSHFQAVSVVRKWQDDFLRNLVTIQVNDTLQRTVNMMYKDEQDYKEVFESLKAGDKLIARVSDINPAAVRIVNWQPTNEEIERNGKISPNAIIATINSKEIGHVYKEDEHLPIYRVQLLVDGVRSNNVEIPGKEKDERKQLYNSLDEGDTVLIKVDETTDSVAVINWHPTRKEINVSSADSLQSKQYYKQLGYIFKKDSRGITKQFNTMVYFGKEKAKQWKLERSMFENINVGDTLLLEFSDENEDYCKVISWHPTPEEKELYRTQVPTTE
ncbi:MAG: hypothetical protein J6Y82_12050 [Bacteroidales bacterium]|nr:hypothetical protein [Bacteroidales bacterium]